MKLLHLDSSILGAHSVSRQLSSEIVAREITLHPGIEVIYHDLAADAALHLSGAHMAVRQGAALEDTSLGNDIAKGDAYVEELIAADIVVIGAPMYNFSIPTQLKAWIDRVAVAGKTFRYGADGPEGLLSQSKKLIIAAARGSVYAAGTPAAAYEHHDSYLKGLMSFLGITDITVIRAEGLAFSTEAKEASIKQALNEIAALAA
ncbi:FMN-dependent NADH-azoreductase [Undibacterium sp. TC4M20W]|uniref:FMN-dependent NADH-azoreductase n=1 Tax=Undibacterium sp. TC4M20W TaxID=3413052 RepID=UPI003BF37776